ncbi:MAG TPA: EamA family transporter, partial [bacterium]|nr:EamA family transporter [bacterium]
TLLAALPHWQWPTWPQLGVLAALGALGNLGQVTLSQALKEADASAVLPLDFLRIIWNSLLGYVIFMEVPTVWTWIGGTIIFASTTWLTLRESRPARG